MLVGVWLILVLISVKFLLLYIQVTLDYLYSKIQQPTWENFQTNLKTAKIIIIQLNFFLLI